MEGKVPEGMEALDSYYEDQRERTRKARKKRDRAANTAWLLASVKEQKREDRRAKERALAAKKARGPKKRTVRKKRRPALDELANANKKWEEWETKRRLADTKTRYWRARVVTYQKKVEQETALVVAKLEQQVAGRTSSRPRRAIDLDD